MRLYVGNARWTVLPFLVISVWLLFRPPVAAQAQPAGPPVMERGFADDLSADQHAYWAELTARAGERRLWEQRVWHLLLHYWPDSLGSGVTSQADGEGLFLAPDGKTNPRAELEATLAAFFVTRRIPPTDQTPQCAFPARRRWLYEQLGIDPQRLPLQTCPKFEAWLAQVDAGSVSLIFSSFWVNNPASMFGHTLLRFNRKQRSADTALLDSAVNFAAAIPDGTGNWSYAWGGLTGGFRGYFSLLPYYLKVREYNDIENRDLWEYELDYSPEQVDFMLRHAWEMDSTYFDYYFFDENCSYHLLSLLEIGRPELHLREDYGLWTLPTDTVHQIVAQPGLVTDVIYRPSQSSHTRQLLNALTPDEATWASRLIDDPQDADTEAFAALRRTRAALVLDTAIGYYQYRLADRPEGEQDAKRKLRQLLLRRSRIRPDEVEPLDLPPLGSPPHEGHYSSRVAVGAGASRPPLPEAVAMPGERVEKENFAFGEIQIQAAYHNLLSDDRAVAPNSQINLLHGIGRYDDETRHWRLERFALVDVMSIDPITRVSGQPSWRMEFAWQRNRDGACADCTPFRAAGGLGASAETNLLKQEVYYLLVDVSLEFHEDLVEQHRSGFGVSAGVLIDLADFWRMGLMGTRINYTDGQRDDVGQATLEQRLILSRNLEVVLRWHGVEGYREGSLSMGYYF